MIVTCCELPAGMVLVKSFTDADADRVLARHREMQRCPTCGDVTKHYGDGAGHEYHCAAGCGLVGVIFDPIPIKGRR